jgi:hypothetical protein
MQYDAPAVSRQSQGRGETGRARADHVHRHMRQAF